MRLVLVFGILLNLVFGFSFAKKSKESDKYIELEGKKYLYVIGSAFKGGSYYKSAKKLAYRLPKALAAETEGSLQNLDLLADGMINIAFVQGDAYALYCDKHEEECQKYTIIKTNRTEAIQIIARKGFDLDDLQTDSYKDGNPAIINIGSINSGGAASWHNMTRLEPKFKKAKIVSEDIDKASLIALRDGEVDAIIRTAHFDLNDPFVKQVLRYKNLRFIDVDDWDLNDKIELNGKEEALYDFVKYKIKYKGDFFGSKFKTIQTNVYIVINKEKMSKKQLNRVLEVFDRIGNGLWD